MSGIYIPKMGMPEHGEAVTVLPDGTVLRYLVGMRETLEMGTAIPVPDHGRLGDLDALEEYLSNDPTCITVFDALRKLRSMPAIIPADHADKEVEA